MSRLRGIAIKSAPRQPMQELQRADISVERGIAGDFRGAQRDRQVTLLAESAWRAACAEIDADLPWTTRRANLLVDGVDFDAAWTGRSIRIGTVELVVTEETAPCSLMEAQRAGLRSALASGWRGGVCCRVASGGAIAVGDAVTFDPAD